MKANATMTVVLLAACASWAQSPQIISNARQKVQEAQKTWNAHQPNLASPAAPAKPAAGVPAASSKRASKLSKADAIAASLGVRPAKSLLPQNETNTQAGEEHFTTAAKRDADKTRS
jgi:hypothetical protein